MAYYRFFLTHPRVLSFGILLTLFSSFGQTFLISIFVPQLLDTFQLNTAQFGALYATATLLSATSLPYFGRLIDRTTLRTFSLAVGTGLVCACLAMASAPHVAILFLAILGLRLTGQGLLSLTASTTMARVFHEGRGKALSVSGLGYPLGEGILPMGVVLLVHTVGWRLSWAILGILIALLLLPAMASLLKDVEHLHQKEIQQHRSQTTPLKLWRDWRFLFLLPGTLFIPCVLTALFLYQLPLAEHQSWSASTVASAFVGFAAARMVTSLAVGPIIDRYGALRLYPAILLPLSLGLALLSSGQQPWIAYAYLALAGISQGIASPTQTALLAQVYGTHTLGTTKGTLATCAIFMTALGPVALGSLLKAEVPFSTILPCLTLASITLAAVSFLAAKLILPTTHQASPTASPTT
jgi:MFS family permease